MATSMSVSSPEMSIGEVPHGGQNLVEKADAHVHREEAGTTAARQSDRYTGDDVNILFSSGPL
jgi:hypothetical protein